ncbi:MAG TPA: hypothetical protein VGK67_39560 [Myxococcales bacterium]|jgi:hypothetical protein
MNAPVDASQAWPPLPPPHALQCPRCGAAAHPAGSLQTCRCGLRFALFAGAFLDRSIAPPPPDPEAETIVVRGSGMLRRYGKLEPDAVVEGALDPVVAWFPMTASRIAYRAIYTIAVWKQVPWRTVAAILLVPFPFTLILAAAYRSDPMLGVLVLLVAMAVLTLGSLASLFLAQRHHVRVVGARQTLHIRFDRPLVRRHRFHDELLRRCGLPPSPFP